MASVDEERIRIRAHEIWETEGRPQGRDREHWEQACRELGGRPAEDASFGRSESDDLFVGEAQNLSESMPADGDFAGLADILDTSASIAPDESSAAPAKPARKRSHKTASPSV